MAMITDPEKYFRKFIPARDEVLLQLEQEAKAEGIPIVGPLVGELLYILARATQARAILELGAATGYSAIYLARGCEPVQGRVITLEWDERLAARARANLAKAGLADRVEVQVGDALKLMGKLNGPFDLVFMDIDKESYLPALAHCHRLLKIGGLLVTDNVGFAAAEPFNQAIFEDRRWRLAPLLCYLPEHSPERDGLSIALKVG